MQATQHALCCPVCGHHGCQVLKQNSPVPEFLPADLIASRTSKRQCQQCQTTFFPERESDSGS